MQCLLTQGVFDRPHALGRSHLVHEQGCEALRLRLFTTKPRSASFQVKQRSFRWWRWWWWWWRRWWWKNGLDIGKSPRFTDRGKSSSGLNLVGSDVSTFLLSLHPIEVWINSSFPKNPWNLRNPPKFSEFSGGKDRKTQMMKKKLVGKKWGGCLVRHLL